MKLSIAWIFDHIDACYKTIDIQTIVDLFNRSVAEIEEVIQVEDDWIINIDNKSITHRPDLWSHRGAAREIAALLNVPLKPISVFCDAYPTQDFSGIKKATTAFPITVAIDTHVGCNRFSCVYIDNIHMQETPLWIVARLEKVEMRSINVLVDLTNYVMFDIGQPLHVFDAVQLEGSQLSVKRATEGQVIQLIEGSQVKLTSEDIVIVDASNACSLAGISGGRYSGVTNNTQHVFLEAAHFDPVIIRRTALRVKVRTEAAMRFEKNIDPALTVSGITRFLKLLSQIGIHAKISDICSWGILPKPKIIFVEHAYIEKMIGIPLASEMIISILQKLEFAILAEGSGYHVTVPSFRATKDIVSEQDIVEEISRMIGYDTITPISPIRAMNPFPISQMMRIRYIKRLLAYKGAMHEVHNYALFDESFLRTLNWQPKHVLEIQNPLSEQWCRLVTSLIPHLIKNVYTNQDEATELRFFELARTWGLTSNQQSIEQKVLAGIMFHKRGSIDFYQSKQIIQVLYDSLQIPISFMQLSEVSDRPWYMPYRSAVIMHVGTVIGYMGMINPEYLGSIVEGSGFVFELDADFILSYTPLIKQYVPLSKYPLVHRDISCLVPKAITVDHCLQAIQKSNPHVIAVELIDLFEKNEWKDERSLTFCYTLSDQTKTLNKEELDIIYEHIVQALKELGAIVR